MKRSIVWLALVGAGAVFLLAVVLGVVLVFYPLKYKAEIVEASKVSGLSPALIASVINTESHFNPFARSHAGACGLMQLMPATAKEVATKLEMGEISDSQIFNPATNILLGSTYLSQLILSFGDLKTALSAYNAGPSKVKSWLSNPQYSTDGAKLINTPYKETNNYVKKVLTAKKFYSFYLFE